MKRIGDEFYYLQATRFSIRSNVTNQDKPCGICLERRKSMIKTCQIGPCVKKKKKKKEEEEEEEGQRAFLGRTTQGQRGS